MKRFLITMIMVFLVVTPGYTYGMPYLVVEPPMDERTSLDLAANGMLYASYDLDRNGISDFHTLRVVERSFFSAEPVYAIGLNFPDNLIFFVDYASTRFYYIADMEPTFYAVDVNEDGHWDLVYKDTSQDGVNGNESFYDSPSGMFTARIENF